MCLFVRVRSVPDEKWADTYFGPYFSRTGWGMERLYCGDSNGHAHFESFRSHISLTLRTSLLFIFRRLTGGLAMGWNIFPGLLINAQERGAGGCKAFIYQCGGARGEETQAGKVSWGLSGADIVQTANAARVQKIQQKPGTSPGRR